MLVPPVLTFGGASTPEQALSNVRSCLARNLPSLDKQYEAHDRPISICAGGPSLADTYKNLEGKVVAVNKAHDFLIERGIVPLACALLDPIAALADAITPRKGVQYLVASKCHPAVFDKLDGHDVVVWHAAEGAQYSLEGVVRPGQLLVYGGSTVSLRFINIAYILGFRDFHLHGFDSSFRRVDGVARHHAYDYEQDDNLIDDRVTTILGHETYLALYSQVTDFFLMMDVFDKPYHDPCTFTLHGDGLLQHAWKMHTGSNVYRTQTKAKENAHA